MDSIVGVILTADYLDGGALALAALLLGVMVVIAAWFRPDVLLAVAAFIVPSGSFHPELRLVSPLGQLTPFQIVVFVASIVVAVRYPTEVKRSLRSAPALLGAGISIAGTISVLWSSDLAGLYYVLNLGLLLVALAIAVGPRWRRDPESVALWLVIGAGVSAVSILVEFALQTHVGWFGTDVPAGDSSVFRPRGIAGNPILSSASIAVVFAILLASPARMGLAAPIVLPGLVLAVFASYSRSAILATAISLVLYVLRPHAAGSKLWRRIVVGFVGIPALYALYQSAADVILLRGSATSDTLRVANLQLAWEQFLVAPWLGLGMGGFKRALLGRYPDRIHLATSDNALVTIGVDLGVFGLLVFALVFLAVVRKRVGLASPGSVIPAIAFIVASLFFDSIYHDVMIFLLAVVLLTATTSMDGCIESGNGAVGERGRRTATARVRRHPSRLASDLRKYGRPEGLL